MYHQTRSVKFNKQCVALGEEKSSFDPMNDVLAFISGRAC